MVLKKDEKYKFQGLKRLGLTDMEAYDVIDCDREIDNNIQQEFDLSPEEEKMAKKYANATTKKRKAPPAYNFPKKARKGNPTKASIIVGLVDFLQGNEEIACEDIVVVNKERIIEFSVGEDRYKLTLSKNSK